MSWRITKDEYDSRGGMKNSDLFRRQTPSGRWLYYAGATS